MAVKLFAFFPFSFSLIGQPISPFLTLLTSSAGDDVALFASALLSDIFSAEYCTPRLRFQHNHQGILHHSTGATPPVSVNVVE